MHVNGQLFTVNVQRYSRHDTLKRAEDHTQITLLSWQLLPRGAGQGLHIGPVMSRDALRAHGPSVEMDDAEADGNHNGLGSIVHAELQEDALDVTLCTVSSLISSAPEISLFLSPLASSCTTSSSRAVNGRVAVELRLMAAGGGP